MASRYDKMLSLTGDQGNNKLNDAIFQTHQIGQR